MHKYSKIWSNHPHISDESVADNHIVKGPVHFIVLPITTEVGNPYGLETLLALMERKIPIKHDIGTRHYGVIMSG